jgi:glutaredoxin
MEPAVDLLLDKLPPSNLEKNVQWFGNRPPKQKQSVDLPKKKHPKQHLHHYIPFSVHNNSSQKGEKPFLIFPYNDVGDHYRSPWTNRLYRYNEQGDNNNGAQIENNDLDTSNERLRNMEVEFNKVWEAYKNLYYGVESVGSVYLNNEDDNATNFGGCFCIQKLSSDCGASWNSISFVHAQEVNECEYNYIVDTTVHTVINPIRAPNNEQCEDSTSGTNNVAIGTTMTKSFCKTCKVHPDTDDIHKSHIEHIGTIIEANETELRTNLERNVIPKHHETVTATQKKQTRRPQVNPLMSMMMNSDMLKKRLAKTNPAES